MSATGSAGRTRRGSSCTRSTSRRSRCCIVFGELTHGIVEPASRERFAAIVGRLVREEGADAAALACTEFSMLVDPAALPVPGFDTTALHCAAALDWMLA